MKKKALAVIMAMTLASMTFAGCGASNATAAEETTVESTAESAAEEAATESTAESTAESAAVSTAADSTAVADITTSLVGNWQDGTGSTLTFNEDYTFSGVSQDGTTASGTYSLVTDGTYVVLSLKGEGGSLTQYYVQAASDYSQFVLTNANDASDIQTLTPVQ